MAFFGLMDTGADIDNTWEQDHNRERRFHIIRYRQAAGCKADVAPYRSLQ